MSDNVPEGSVEGEFASEGTPIASPYGELAYRPFFETSVTFGSTGSAAGR